MSKITCTCTYCAHVRVHVHVHVPCMHMYMCRECVPELGNVRVVVAYVIIYFTCVPPTCLLLAATLYLDLPADFIRCIASAQRQRRPAPETGESVSRTPVRVRRMFMHLMRPHCHPGRRTPPTSNTLKSQPLDGGRGGRSPAQHNVPQAAIHAQKSRGRGGGDAPHRAGGDNRRRRPAATPRARDATRPLDIMCAVRAARPAHH
jgi:hypothetical protein